MFGLFKQQISPTEFGQGIMQLAHDFMSSDSARAVAMRLEGWDDHNGSTGWSGFIERKGIPMQTQKLHYKLWAHCAVQGTCTQVDADKRRAITRGAMDALSNGAWALKDYDFVRSYDALENIYRGQHKFDPTIESLTNPGVMASYLPNPKTAVLNAKYLIEAFAIPYLPNNKAFITEFQSYSSTVGASIGTVSSAMNHILAKFKL